jgi:hypothetical protein
VAAGKAIPGVFEVPRAVSLATAIEDLLLIAECSRFGEWEEHLASRWQRSCSGVPP